MAKFFGNLHLVLAVGLIFAIVVIMAFSGYTGEGGKEIGNDVLRWLHSFFSIMWIGLLYYLNFVQVPTMPKIPAELKPAVTGHIAPRVFFFFRWSALITVLLGLAIAFHNGYGAQALTFGGTGADGINMIGLGMWLALIMAFNVWFIIWPAQKKALGLVESDDATKAKAAVTAKNTSRINTLLSIPMLYAMASYQTLGS